MDLEKLKTKTQRALKKSEKWPYTNWRGDDFSQVARVLLEVIEELEQTKKFIAQTADNHIDLCRQLGTHRPIADTGCFGDAQCVNCFRIGFTVYRYSKSS